MHYSHQIECKAFRPLQDWLILAPEKIEGKMEGGIYVPLKPHSFGRCKVMGAGPDCSLTAKDVVWMQNFVEGELRFVLNGIPCYAIREKRVNVALKGKGLKAVGDRILVQRIETQKPERGGIFIPNSAKEASQECEVVSVGAKVKVALKPGMHVLIGKYGGTEVKRDKLSLTIINENDIVGAMDK